MSQRLRKLLSLTFLAALAGTPAGVGAQGSETAPGGGATTTGQPRLICRSQGSSSSRLRSNRVCRTAAQWQRAEDDTNRELARATRSMTDNRCPMPGQC